MAEAMVMAQRRPVLAGRAFEAAHVAILAAPPATHISLRAPAASLAALSQVLGLEMPGKPRTSVTNGSRSALWLGPDEWLILDAADSGLVETLSRVEALHSAVDISHRNVAITVSGPAAEAVLSAGCPRDLRAAAFPAGAVSRTVLGKAETVVMRTGAEAFRVEIWRSFATYAFDLLEAAARAEAR